MKNSNAALSKSARTNEKRKNLIAKILCALIAVIMWFYVVSTDTTLTTQVFPDIEVTMQGLEHIENELGLSVVGEGHYTVNLTLSGKKTELGKLSSDGKDISAYVDLSGITKAGNYELSVKYILPSGITVSKTSSKTLNIYIDKTTSLGIPIVLGTPQYSMNSKFELGEPVIKIGDKEVTEAIVTGPAEELAKIDHLTSSISLGSVSGTTTATGKLTPVLKSGITKISSYVKIPTTDITVIYPVYAKKKVKLTYSSKYGYLNDTNISVKIEPSEIQLKGDPAVLNTLNELVVTEIDEKKLAENNSTTVTITVPDTLSSSVELADTENTATVTVTNKNTSVHSVIIPNDKIKVKNPNSLKYSIKEDSITVKLRGSPDGLKKASADTELKATVDLSYLDSGAGQVTSPVVLELPSGVWELGEYSVTVTVE